jgi:hypothetical protein
LYILGTGVGHVDGDTNNDRRERVTKKRLFLKEKNPKRSCTHKHRY